MERREGARGLVRPSWAGVVRTRRVPGEGHAPACEAGGAPLALHPAMRIVGAPRFAPPSNVTRDDALGEQGGS
jgi:hypothetical protein